MHEGEIAIDDDLVRQLVDGQFTRWAELPLRRVASHGTVHAMYRLGTDLVVRLPLLTEFTPALEREMTVLPALARHLPAAIPTLVARGKPTDRYPSSWSVLTWIDGVDLASTPDVDANAVAIALGEFVRALRRVSDPGPASTNQRGRPVSDMEDWTRSSIEAVSDEFDADAMTRTWESALDADPWDGVPRWIHGDLLPANLVIREGLLAAVIDFGECAIGNPTYDLVAGWWVLDPASREVFRDAVGADEHAWRRARGFALAGGVGALAYYRDTNPGFAGQARRTIRAVLDEG